jgi:hypothetical protein
LPVEPSAPGAVVLAGAAVVEFAGDDGTAAGELLEEPLTVTVTGDAGWFPWLHAAATAHAAAPNSVTIQVFIFVIFVSSSAASGLEVSTHRARHRAAQLELRCAGVAFSGTASGIEPAGVIRHR